MNYTITSISSNISSVIHQLYEQAFPEHERRPWNQQVKLIQAGLLQADEIKIDGVFAGFIFYWNLTGFVFIEHFAIAENIRGKGMGATMLRQFAGLHQTIILETEPPGISADALRRIAFYQKAGFILFDEDYMQPPYTQGNAYFPMRLMHYQLNKSQQTFIQIKDEIYAAVYGIK